MKEKDYIKNHLEKLNDNDKVVIVLYSYGFYVDDSLHGVHNDRNYKTKKDILENITNPDWYYCYYWKEETQEIDGEQYLILKGSFQEPTIYADEEGE